MSPLKSRFPPVLPAAYPTTIVYVAGVGVCALLLAGTIKINVALLIFTLVYVLTAFTSVRKELIRVRGTAQDLYIELERVHSLVNSKSDAQLDRIAELERLLKNAEDEIEENEEHNTETSVA